MWTGVLVKGIFNSYQLKVHQEKHAQKSDMLKLQEIILTIMTAVLNGDFEKIQDGIANTYHTLQGTGCIYCRKVKLNTSYEILSSFLLITKTQQL